MATTRIWQGGGADQELTTAGNYVGAAAPVSTDTVIFPALAAASAINVAGGDHTAILLVETIVEAGNYSTFGTRTDPLMLDTDYLSFAGSGLAFIKVVNSTRVDILAAASASDSSYGVYVYGGVTATNALLIIDCGDGNTVGVASLGDDTAEFTTIEIGSGTVAIGDAVTCTTMNITGGEVVNLSDMGTINVGSGTLTQEKNNPTTLNIQNGTVYYNSTDMPTTINLYGGTLDLSKDGRAKTFPLLNWYGGNIVDPHNVGVFTTTNFKSGGDRSMGK